MRTVAYYAVVAALIVPGAVGAAALAVRRVARWRDQWTRRDVAAMHRWDAAQIATARAIHPSANRSPR